MMSGAFEMSSMLLVRARNQLCALPLSDVVETMRPPPLRPLSSLSSFVMGVAVIRGAPVPVVDLGALLGAEDPPAPARVVTVRAGTRTAGVAVEDVVGVRRVAPAVLQSLPPLVASGSSDAIARLGVLDRDLLAVLDGARLVPDEVWAELDASEAGR